VFGHFILHKINADILEFAIPAGNDLIYFDAFSPDKEPLLWSEHIFRKIYDSMTPGGVFVTYSAKGEVKRKLLSTGFRVERIDGPPGKRHILRAVK
jgi:tRNA U34 5-methylaminomethyl-2-thiouridine-forming methyltransferase MnmC